MTIDTTTTRPSHRSFGRASTAALAALTLAVSACGGGSNTSDDITLEKGRPTFSVGGTVNFSAPSTAALTLRVTAANGSSVVVDVANNAPAGTAYTTFNTAFVNRSSYTVEILPSDAYLCLITGAPTGTIRNANVTSATISCTTLPPKVSVDFTVRGAPVGSSLTVGYFDLQSDTSVQKTFVIGASGATYSFDETFPEGVQLQFGVIQSPVGQRCTTNSSILVVNLVEPVVTCASIVNGF
jgi:hypothetical protein